MNVIANGNLSDCMYYYYGLRTSKHTLIYALIYTGTEIYTYTHTCARAWKREKHIDKHKHIN